MTKNEMTIRPKRLLLRFDIITLSIALPFLVFGKITGGEKLLAACGFVIGILLPQFILNILLEMERKGNKKKDEDEDGLWQ